MKKGSGKFLVKYSAQTLLREFAVPKIELEKQNKQLQEKIIECKKIESELRYSYRLQYVLGLLLFLSLEKVSLEELLDRALGIILNIPNIFLEPKGAIFLKEKGNILKMKVHRGFSKKMRKACSAIPFGRCYCGRAAKEKKIQISSCVGASHENICKEIEPHGHYCVPIMSGDEVLGVLNAYFKESGVQQESEEVFFTSIAYTLAGIIERKRAEETLRQKEEQYRKQFDEATDAIFLADAKTEILLDCNIAATRLVEREKSEIIGMHQKFLHTSENKSQEFSKMFRQHIEGDPTVVIEDKIITKSGQIKDVAIKASKIIFQDRENLQGIFRDITVQKHMEDKLRQSIADLRLAQRIAGVASWSWDAKNDVVTWSDELYRITGRDPKCFVPTYAKLPQLYTPESWQRLSRAVNKALSEGTPYELELEIVRPDGQHRWTLAFGEPISKILNAPPCLFGVVLDITERKQMEQAKKTLVIDVSHSLKTPLAMIEMALNMVKEGIRLNDAKRIEKGLLIGYDNIARSRKYINRMLEAFTVDLREVNLKQQKKKVSLGKIVSNIFKEIKLITQERGLQLRVDIPAAANMVKAGEKELSVIMENLLDNALKFTQKGSISVISRRKKEWVEVRVKDTGCGIDPNSKIKLFEMFSKRYTVTEGLGLGLFICKRLTELLGGEIHIESKGIGKGAEVILRLPC